MRYCGHCGEMIWPHEVGVLVAIRNEAGQSLVTGRVPMHLVCTLEVAAHCESVGGTVTAE